MSKNLPLVSVCMITYNHEKFIAEAIEGVLMQDVDFEVELIIADDCSTDRTGEIIQNYIDHHPRGNWIKYTFHQINLGMMPNFIWALETCQGKYIALCEGDDFWTDSLKLHKQVSFLQVNSEFSLCYHPVKILTPNGDFIDDYIAERFFKAPESSIIDLAIYGNYIHTPSVIFRSDNFSASRNFSKSPVGDYFLYLLVSQTGRIKRLNFFGVVYRFGSGVHSSLTLEKRKLFRKQTLLLASQDIQNSLVSFILKLRIHHNSILGKLDHEIFQPSDVTNFSSFFSIVKKVELIKALIKWVFHKKIEV